ncbi:DUF4136 domain-containing protein [Panacibacter sp. DH6]|uniref:DUF4136 domain-containing protein n=1 Tax=Panacibacter microcysteis TaxID=2793269 RepID=A0A931GWF6_9BACT|nr:DUF4136 domain-containing protein [Panacibacter microcysteis]MBG9376273.1 DUF4136 domain-containing protein [Panacibacter microcysteis]
MKRTLVVLSGAVLIAATGCQKDPLNNLTPEESRIYVTNYDSSANFESYKTYNLADSVAVIDNGKATKEATASDRAYVDAVNKYMQERGYTKVSKAQSPDLGLTVNRIYQSSSGVVTYGDYWDYYGGYWDPYYWGYGGYGYYVPYGYSVFEITEGAVSIDMLDLKDAAGSNKISLIWNGLVRGTGIFNETNADAQVKALFDQSQYIKTNN